MASKNQVTLTFAGDSSDLEKAFGRVGESAQEMSSEVDSASTKIRGAGEGFDVARESADELDTKAMGFRDTMTGVQDSMLGVGEIARGNLFEGFFTLGMGVGDLASGFANFLIPSMKNFTKSAIASATATVRDTAAKGAHKVAAVGSAIATKGMTAAQWALNAAMRANPIGIVITILAALGAAIVIAWKKSETFRNIVKGAMHGIRVAFGWVLDRGRDLLGWFRDLPGKIGGFFSGLGDLISRPFVTAFGWVKSMWNSTVGGFGFDIPGWLGGGSFRIPTMHQGGIVPGSPGSETLALLQAGEKVTPASQAPKTVALSSDGSALSDLIVDTLRGVVRAEGGNVQFVLGQA